jgi:hypothetical protein
MTRNIYLGADLSPLFAVTSIEELIAVATRVWAIVQETDFPARAKLLAEEIVDSEPHIVGLQEVSLWRTQTPSDGSPTPNATDVEYDFLQILLQEIRRRGGRYAPVATVDNFDGEVPILTPSGLQDLRLTDRDVMLARTDLPRQELSVANGQGRNFDARIRIPNPVLGEIVVLRGWTAVDVMVRGIPSRVVNTHLEVVDPRVQIAQGDELLAGPLQTTLPAVLVGDLNSAADGNGAPGQSDTPTYQNILDAGFVDSWRDRPIRSLGYTCCQAEDLLNERSTLTERIDFVLSRGSIIPMSARRIGADSSERTPRDLWPSDHAGVVANLRLRRS